MVSEQKIKLVRELTKDINEYPIVALLNLQNLPAPQLQTMRALLKNKNIKISMARKRLLQRAIDESKKTNIQQLNKKIKGMPALLFSKDNPFTLNKLIEKNKSEAPAKAGQEAPNDIIVRAGPTNFAPGPIISELASVGIKTKVDNGKLTIIEDTTVAKEGDEISPKLAETLKRLDIKPMEIGLNLVAVWEDGVIFDSKQLHIDEEEYKDNITKAAQWAINLAMETAYPTKETTELLLQKAQREAKAVGVECSILSDETKEEVLAKTEQQALSLKKEVGLEDNKDKEEEKDKEEGRDRKESKDKKEEKDKDKDKDLKEEK